MKTAANVFANLLAVVLLGAIPAHAEEGKAATPAEPQVVADRIASEIAQLRGLPFKRPVKVQMQSTESFGEYVSRELDDAIPESSRSHYGTIVRALGLYRGPRIEDFSGMMATVMSSQIGAYYDPEKQSFFVLMANLPEVMQGVMYSHELYHALQDQYFDLAGYLKTKSAHDAGSFNSDNRLARSAVVEGEATYMMSLWMMQKMAGKPATREMMSRVVAVQADLSMDKLREMLKQPQVAQVVGAEMSEAMETSGNIPSFIMDSMMGVYLKGLSFVFAVHEQGWAAVEKLYTEYPPQSTEQILHPEKWLAREAPTAFAWPKFDKIAALRDWELLEEDVLGEFQWRIIFKEQGFAPQAQSAAAGWAGDRYAVFKRKNSESTLLLLRTSWDSEADAREFTEIYRAVQDVFVVEGGDAAAIDKLLKVVKGVKPRRN